MAVFTCVLAGAGAVSAAAGDTPEVSDEQRVVTIYDQGEKRVVLTGADTVQNTLEQADISLAEHDRVEPAPDTKYTTGDYTVNIYRAYPVTVIDGMKRTRILTPYRDAPEIARDAGVDVQDEDVLTLSHSTDVLADGIGTHLNIDRAVPLTLSLYGVRSQVYTQATTVREFLQEKNISLTEADTMSVMLNDAIARDMTIEIWRDGTQTATSEESIEFPVRQILSADHPVGYQEVKTAGVLGKKKVVYEIVREGGREVSRTLIQSVVIAEPKPQVEIVGNKPTNPLTAAKGAHHFVDSKGVSHRETYYDLPMNIVMSACGGGGYTVRADGAKVDKDGYILIAANLGNYPRCSVVETSMGLGKVYDTGGFAVRHPHGFDLATDWTKADGI